MKNCLYFTSAFSAGFFCWAVFAINTAFGADAGHGQEHATATGGGHHEASSSGMPQLDASTFPSQLFWLAVSFAILYVIFSKRALPEISGVLENRQNHIQSDLQTAETLKNEAAEAQQTYESSLQNARDEAAKAMADAQNKIKAKAEKQAAAFREKSEKEMLELEKNLNTAKNNAIEDMNNIAAEIASAAAEKIVGINPDIEQAKTVVKSLNGNTNAKAA